MKGQGSKPRTKSPGTVCSSPNNRTASKYPDHKQQRGKLDGKSSNRPTFHVKTSANKKKFGPSKGPKRKNNMNDCPSSTSLNYNVPSTSQQVLVAPKYRNIEQECSDQYLKMPMTGPMKGVASGQTKIYSVPPNVPMAKKNQRKKKNIATSTSGRKANRAPLDDTSQQIVKISTIDSNSHKSPKKSSRNITNLSKVEMNKGCDQTKASAGSRFDSKAKSPRNLSTNRQPWNKNSERRDPSEQRITTYKPNADNCFQSGRITSGQCKVKAPPKIPSSKNESAFRAGMMNNLCDRPESGQVEQQYIYEEPSDRSQLIGTSGKFSGAERQRGIKVICENKGERTSISSMTKATSSQAIDKEKIFYKEPREIQGLSNTDLDVCVKPEIPAKQLCIPEQPSLEELEVCKMKIEEEDTLNEIVEVEAINGPQGRKFYKDTSGKPDGRNIEQTALQPVYKQSSVCKDKSAVQQSKLDTDSRLQLIGKTPSQMNQVRSRSSSRERIGAQMAEQNATARSRREKTVCKDKSEQPISRGKMDSQPQLGPTTSEANQKRNDPSDWENGERAIGESEGRSQFLDQTSSPPDQHRKKIICKDKSQTQKPKVENDSQFVGQASQLEGKLGRETSESPNSRVETDARLQGQSSSQPAEQRHSKTVCKDKSQPPKPKKERSPKKYTSREAAGQSEKKSKAVCKDGKQISSTSLKKNKSKESMSSCSSIKSQPSRTPSTFFGFLGSNKNAKDRGKSQTKNKPSKKKNVEGMSNEKKIVYGTAAVAILLVLGGLGLYYMNMLEFD